MENLNKPTTTTISTIAINAGEQATIVVALLKSIGYANLRIDEMKPRMLELGDNAEETSSLLAIHEDLMHRLKSKEDQVEELLARADNLVTQQKEPDVHVYEAMAESLGLAWRGLNRQLQMREFLLSETVRFYELARRHEGLCSEVRNAFRTTLQRRDTGDLNDTVQEIQHLIDDLIDVTALAIDSGADVITQIRVLGAMTDNVESSQETAEACLLIERTMLKLAEEWELLEESWKNERSKLEMQIDESGTILAHVEEIENWLREVQEQLKEGQNINTLMQQAIKQRKALKEIKAMVELSNANAKLQQRVEQLQTNLEEFMQEIKLKKNENDKVIAWIATANTMLSQLKAMEKDMRNANGAMAGELAPLARQKAQMVINDGRRIAHLDERINRYITTIDNKLKDIEDLAHERIDASRGMITKQLNHFEKWLTESEQLLAVNGCFGSNLKETTNFNSIHQKIVTEIVNKESVINALWSNIHQFDDDQQKFLEDCKRRYESIKEKVNARINLGVAFQQVHKFAKELESSFDSLDVLIGANRAFLNEKLLTQMKEVFRMIEETIKQEKHQGEKYIETAQLAVGKDSELDIESSINSVRNILNEHEQRYETSSENWHRWQQSRFEEQRVIRVVEEVQMWQEETVEIIRTVEEKLLNATEIERREEMKRMVKGIMGQLSEQRNRLEEAERISKQTEGEEAYEKVMMARKKHKEIEERLIHIQERIQKDEQIDTIALETKIMRAPEITSPLHDAQIDEGNRFEFTARVEGYPLPDIHWFKDGRSVEDNIDYRTAFVSGVATLTIDETFVEDTAIYTMRAENSIGVAESSAKLVVKSRSEMDSQLERQIKPHFIRQLSNVTVTEGEDVFLDCVLVAVPEPKVIWYKEEEVIKESDRIELRFEGDHCCLKVKDARMSDAGLYTVKATNVEGETTNFCRLTVQSAKTTLLSSSTPIKPKFVAVAPSFVPSPLKNQIVQEGEKTVFEVRVFGEPPPTVRWKYNDRPVYSTSERRIVEETNGWRRFVIENTLPEHSGIYSIVAENEAGEIRSDAALNVEPRQRIMKDGETIVSKSRSDGFWSDSAIMSSPTPPPVPKHRYYSKFEEHAGKQVTEIGCSPTATVPEFIRPFQNEYYVTEGSKFKMDCLLIGNPRPKVHWYFNNMIINVNSKFCTFSNISDTYSIILEPARLDHDGVYKMTAENIRGKTESVFVVHVQPQSLKPSTVEHVRVTEEYGAYEYEQRITNHKTLQQRQYVDSDVRLYGEDQRRLVAKQHSSRLLTPPPAKKQQLQTMHSQQQKLSEHYDVEESGQLGRPPHFTQTLISAVAACGDEAKFQGIVTGWPTPEVTWTKDGYSVSKTSHPDLVFSNVGGHVSLSFPSAKLEDAGKYMCTAKNATGVATSSAQLVVRPRTIAPDFVRRLISEEVAEGETLKWTVQITGDPQPKVTWLRDGQIIPNCDEVCLTEEGDGIHSMIIVKVEMADSGQFTCLAENIAGEARSTADLVVRPTGSKPGSYFHVTKVTQEKQIKGEGVNRNESLGIENPRSTPASVY